MRWLEAYSSHRVGVGSVSAVCPRAGGISRRRSHEIIVVVVVVVVSADAVPEPNITLRMLLLRLP